jgi:DNA-binding MarR family transcriptional regulator
MSPSVLGERLRSLERVGVIEFHRNPTGRGSTYHLTEAGRQLAQVILALGIWGQRWLEIGPEHLDPDVLMWQVFKHLEPSCMPDARKVVRFELHGVRRTYWLVLARDDPDLCYTDPGFGDDLVVSATVEALIRIYLGQWSVTDAVNCGQVQTKGSRELSRAMSEWFPRSGFAQHAQPVRYDRETKSFVAALR